QTNQPTNHPRPSASPAPGHLRQKLGLQSPISNPQSPPTPTPPTAAHHPPAPRATVPHLLRALSPVPLSGAGLSTIGRRLWSRRRPAPPSADSPDSPRWQCRRPTLLLPVSKFPGPAHPPALLPRSASYP